jgi:hypothetical protein
VEQKAVIVGENRKLKDFERCHQDLSGCGLS